MEAARRYAASHSRLAIAPIALAALAITATAHAGGSGGACCFTDGPCTSITESECTAAGGQFTSVGTHCSEACFGACCQNNLCFQTSELFCTAGSGVFFGFDVPCTGIECPAACCLPDGSCTELTVADCAAANGGHMPDEVCSSTFCLGACCLPDDRCLDVPIGQCDIVGGEFLGADVVCLTPFCVERPHPGWNHVSTEITLTKNEPAYWSALSGQPRGVAPFTVLDPGDPPGRPALDGSGDRLLRGFIVAWAVDSQNREIRWNHLKGDAVIVDFDEPSAWEYVAWAFQNVAPVGHGEQSGDPGVISLDGVEYARGFDQLILDFYASGSQPFDHDVFSASVDTDLTLHPISIDLRQEDDGPVTVKAKIDVWNEHEVKFNGTERCITCWDQTLLHDYTEFGVPNNFLYEVLQTDKGKARIDGLQSQNCDGDIDPTDGPLGTHPHDIVSENASLLGVAAKWIRFNVTGLAAIGGPEARAGMNLIGSGVENAVIQYDVLEQTPESAGQRSRRNRFAPTEGVAATQDRVSGSEKGSLLIFSKVEIRWDAQGDLKQDTFIDITNDFGEDVTVQMYFINGDAPSFGACCLPGGGCVPVSDVTVPAVLSAQSQCATLDGTFAPGLGCLTAACAGDDEP